MSKFFLVTVFILLGAFVYSQKGFCAKASSKDFPKNPEAGKCYAKCFKYDRPFKWEQVKCIKAEDRLGIQTTEKQKLEAKERSSKFKKYQEKLKELGYDFEVDGKLNRKFLKAHHKYLRDKEKQVRKASRKAKKQKTLQN